MEKLIGRIAEKKVLETAMASNSTELVAIYGRRRVGKTFLIRSVYEKQILFEFTGVKNANLSEQLENFSRSLKKATGSPSDFAVPTNWSVAFDILEKLLEPIVNKKKQSYSSMNFLGLILLNLIS